MFEKSKKKFIIRATLSIGLVYLLLVLAINIIVIFKFSSDSNRMATLIMDNKIETQFNPNNPNTSLPGFNGPLITDETFYETRFFRVDYSNSNEYVYDLSHSVANITKASEMTEIVLNSGSLKGYIGKYRFLVDTTNKTIVFLNCEKSFNNVSLLLFFSSLAYISGMGIIYLLIRTSANKFLKPVKDSYDKQNQFITNASHELKTPLTIISANNELIEISNGENEYSTNINKQVSKMTNMIKDLTTLAKIQEIEKTNLVDFNLTNLANKILDSFKLIFDQSNIEYEYKVDDNLIVHSDHKLIQQMLSIILDNANKYSKSYFKMYIYKDKKSVTIKAYNDSDLEDGNLTYLTERFYRKDNDRVKKEGSGIGLSLLSAISNQLSIPLDIYSKGGIYNIVIKI